VQRLENETLIPAHRPPAGPELLGDYLVYFSEVTGEVRKAISAGCSLEETLGRVVQSERFSLPAGDPNAAVMTGRHRYNVQRTYLAMAGQ
ncbi:MAG: hypothetical protein QF787_00815, partial [Nitrospinota bacterium]|nr:hypothetical protein [Nitrospinota bacterium]